MTVSESISETILHLRQHLGLTQEKFAAQLGVSFSTLNRWENGRTQPSPLAKEKIQQLLYQTENSESNS